MTRRTEQTTRETYRQLSIQAHAAGDQGEPQNVTIQKALNFVGRHVAKGAVLTIGYAISTKTGNMMVTVALITGSQVIQSPSLDAMAWGMGAFTAARMLIEFSRMYNKTRSSIAYDEKALSMFSQETQGHWPADD